MAMLSYASNFRIGMFRIDSYIVLSFEFASILGLIKHPVGDQVHPRSGLNEARDQQCFLGHLFIAYK